MREDSPTQFVRFKRKRGVYERGLELVVQVQAALDHANIRHYLKDTLDRHVTALVVAISQADTELPSQRWRPYRRACTIANQVRVELDIIVAHGNADERVARAAASARKLCEELAQLGQGR